MINGFSKEQFIVVFEQLGVNPAIDRDTLFSLYEDALLGASELLKSNILGRMVPINSVILILYLINEYGFYKDVNHLDNTQILESDEARSYIVSISLDKYFTNEHLNFKNKTMISKFSPQISTLSLYFNFVLGVLNKSKKNNPHETLVVDMLSKGFSMAKAISELIVDGFETEAFSTWRTLHETECILAILDEYGDKAIKAYLRHMNYAMAFRGVIKNKEKVDAIFVEIKEKMREHDLKSKDMKKFIEYGYLFDVIDLTSFDNFKLNFRDGVERVAKLDMYSKNYEMASEIAHSSPLLIYSKNEYFYHLTLLNLLESFFRLEKIFVSFYLKTTSEEEQKRFFMMRDVYYKNLELIYKNERAIFVNFNKQNKKEA